MSEKDKQDAPLGGKRGMLFLLAVAVAFMQTGFFVSRSSEQHPSTSSSSPNVETTIDPTTSQPRISQHPIPYLMAQAEDKHREFIARQSKTLEDCVKEYKRRYGIDPPKGFDKWWEWAEKRKVKIKDDYDAVMEDLAPFRNLSGEELRRRVQQVTDLPSIDLVRVTNHVTMAIQVHKKNFTDTEVSARAHGWRRILEKFQEHLPDMEFPINSKAEGRVLVPWEHRKYPNMTNQDSSVGVDAMLGEPFIADWRGQGNVWEAYRRICRPESEARRLFSSLRLPAQSNPVINYLEREGPAKGPGSDFRFVDKLDGLYNFCENPWAHYQQGHFFSDWRTIPVLYPVFSPGKAQGYLDIRIPSHYYHQSHSSYTYGWDKLNFDVKETDDNEVQWEKKKDLIFWRGATTGGGSSPPGFTNQYQRHRFVKMTSDRSENERVVVFANPPGSTNFTYTKVPIKELNEEIMDVGFVQSAGNANFPGGMQALYRDHRFAQAVPLSENWAYKYLIDFDGMGYSGRFFALLASESAVIKSTVYREFYSDWIQPWLHFIPLSQKYQELYNIYAFFHGPTPSMLEATNANVTTSTASDDGDRRLRRIARAGKHWKKTMGRKQDMESYSFRLCLEWARLWSDDRESMNFVL